MAWAVYRTVDTRYYFVVRTGQPQDPVEVGQGDTLREAIASLQPTSYQSADLRCCPPTPERFLEMFPDVANDLEEAEDVLVDATHELAVFSPILAIYATPQRDWYFALRIGRPDEHPDFGQGATAEEAVKDLWPSPFCCNADLGCQPPAGNQLHKYFPVQSELDLVEVYEPAALEY